MAGVKFAAGIKPKGSKVSVASVAKNKFMSMAGKQGIGSGMMSSATAALKKREAAIKAAGK
jgi:hypothetical protein